MKQKQTLNEGICYLCNEKCDELSYCHYECAISRAEFLENMKDKNIDKVGVPKAEWENKE